MKYYKTKGTCSSQIGIELDNEHRIKDIEFINGCNGNLKGISSLVKGQKAEDVISKLKGITCDSKSTSCPDQLADILDGIIKGKL